METWMIVVALTLALLGGGGWVAWMYLNYRMNRLTNDRYGLGE